MRVLDSVQMVMANSGKVAAMRCAMAWGTGSALVGKRCLEGNRRDHLAFLV